MRRIPRFIAYITRRYLARFLKRSVDPITYYEVLDRTLEQLPTRWNDWTKEGEFRTAQMNRQLAWSMAFVAGAVNAGGFLALGHYTSHMTGVVSTMADMLAVKDLEAFFVAFGMLICFLGGAFLCTTLISLGKRKHIQARYAYALGVEAALLLLFGYKGATLQDDLAWNVPTTVALLCFIMGMHNAVTTNISGAAVRSTHLTGTVTDIGIELSKLTYRNSKRLKDAPPILADRAKLKLMSLLLVSFFVGGVLGGIGFKHIGFKVTVPLAGFLVLLAVRPLWMGLRILLRHLRRDLRRELGHRERS
ncbi:MAG TPA: YoaK family protein [Holophagaceae bacterium]|nr:YoaK family protein [Holophagaceae bacterium]HJW32853.1 YoaK family protein [Holophagaceae bacterium]